MKWSWRDWLAILALCLMPLLYFAPVIFYGQTFFFHDISTDYPPNNAFNTRTLLQGELPLWNPYLQGGYPLSAETQASALYPLNVILLLPFPIATTHMWYIVVHYMLLGVFTYLLARKGLQLTPIPSLIAGLVFTFSGTIISQLTHIPIISTLAWMPLILLFYIFALEKLKVSYAVAAGVVLAVQISKSQPQMVLYTAGIVTLYACFATFVNLRIGTKLRWCVPFRDLLVVFVVGAGLAAYQIFYTFELIQFSSRADGITYDMITVLSYPPFYLIKFLIPHFFGSFQNYAGAGSFTEIHAYAGILPLILAIFAWINAFAWAKVNRWQIWFFTTLLIISILLSFGKFLPGYYWLQYVPVLNYFRGPARWLLPASFCLAILAAFGTQALIDNEWKIQKPVLRVGISLFFVAIISFLLLSSAAILWDVNHTEKNCTPEDFTWRPRCIFSNPQVYTKYATLMEHDPEQRDYFIIERISNNSYETEQIRELTTFQQRIRLAYLDMIESVGFFLLALSLALALVFVRSQGWIGGQLFGVLAASLVLLDILTYGGLKTNPTTDATYFSTEPDTVQFLKQAEISEPYRIFPTINWIPYIHNTDYVLSTLHFNLPSLYGIESIEGGTSLPLVRHTAYMERAVGQSGGLQMLGIANAKYIITEWVIDDNPDLKPVFEGQRQRIYENLHALPRTFVVHHVEVSNSDSAALDRLADSSFDPIRTIILEESPNISLPAITPSTASSAEIVLHKHNRIEIDVLMSENGFVFLSDVFYPGWNAYVDGESAHIYRANYLFRAVEVSEGNHTVEFRYAPLSFRLGVIVSLLSVMGIVVWAVIRKFTSPNIQIK